MTERVADIDEPELAFEFSADRDPARPQGGLTVRDAGLAVAATLTLEACGEGGSSSGGGTPTPTPTPTPTTPPLTAAQASRFLAQATMGASKADITNLQGTTIDAWLNSQLGLARPQKFWDFLANNGYNVVANINSQIGFDAMMWSQLISSSDTLRQRVGLALLDMLVVSIDGFSSPWRSNVMAAYLDGLWDNAFGNYRDIIDAVASSPAMAYYLTFLGNQKANTTTGSVPDENFARELMQLFTLGLYQLNPDGTQVLSGGKPVETYTQADVSGLARVWTGWNLANNDNTTPDRMRLPLVNVASQHETGVTTFLTTTIPAGTDGPTSKKLALDAIFAHSNLPPFVSKQLIQHMVTSNPSPAYVGRVSAVFANNGNGVRGDMKAVIRAILTDSEARSDANITSTSFGKLREPVVRLTQWGAGFQCLFTDESLALWQHQQHCNPAWPKPRPRAKRVQFLPTRLYPARQQHIGARTGGARIPDRQRAIGCRLYQLYADPDHQWRRGSQGGLQLADLADPGQSGAAQRTQSRAGRKPDQRRDNILAEDSAGFHRRDDHCRPDQPADCRNRAGHGRP